MEEPIYTQPEELLADASFIAWATQANPLLAQSWEARLQQNHRLQQLSQEALQLLQNLVVAEQVPAGQVEAAETALFAGLRPAAPTVRLPVRMRWIAAAALLLLVAGAAIMLQQRTHKTSLQTSFGQISKQVLPDGSEVMLNANSTVAYNKQWEQGGDREVWMNGEAFFHVKKTPNKSRFIVHTGKVDVIVTGTQFNIDNRNHTMSILLTEGSVTLKTDDGQEIHMHPGDYVRLNNNSQLQLTPAKEENVLAWKDRRIIFDNAPVKDVIHKISEDYGVQIQLADDGVADKSISCILPNDNLDVLLRSLEATGEFRVDRRNDTITISKP